MPTLIAHCRFNPPSITFMGNQPIGEETLQELERLLPQRTTTTLATATFSRPAKSVTNGDVHAVESVKDSRGLTTVSSGAGGYPKFQFFNSPPRWTLDVGQHYCNDSGKASLLVTVTNVLAEREQWSLLDSNSVVVNPDKGTEVTRLFFNRVEK